MKTILSTIIILMLALAAFGQTDLPIIGKVSDLTGKTKVYLLAETTKSREKIQKILNKDKTFQIVADAKDADFILEFKPISKTQPASLGIGRFEDVAEMTAYFYNPEKRKVVAWSMTKDKYKKGWGGTKENENFLTNEFLKVVKGKK
jgi:hypothetical protein